MRDLNSKNYVMETRAIVNTGGRKNGAQNTPLRVISTAENALTKKATQKQQEYYSKNRELFFGAFLDYYLRESCLYLGRIARGLI
jgi:hypothetical protein